MCVLRKEIGCHLNRVVTKTNCKKQATNCVSETALAMATFLRGGEIINRDPLKPQKEMMDGPASCVPPV